MDPWLEAADIWPDFHDAFASEIRAALNATLPPPYYARLEMRPEIGVVDDDLGSAYKRRVVPDVTVAESRRSAVGPATGEIAALPRTMISEYVEIAAPAEEGRHLSVEVRDPRRRHRLVTFIEIASPANKTAGADRQSYLQKRDEVFASDASLIEIDLLRAGHRLLPNMHVVQTVGNMSPPPDYLVLVNRAWTRGAGIGTWHVFPVVLRRMLPAVPVPLREGEDEVPLDLQHAFNRAYDSGPYLRGAVDYRLPPHPRLSDSDYQWASERLATILE